jgi:hypothetical protein
MTSPVQKTYQTACVFCRVSNMYLKTNMSKTEHKQISHKSKTYLFSSIP